MPERCSFTIGWALEPRLLWALAVCGELVAPAFIVLGLFTRWMSIPAAITMAVAAFGAHAGDPIGRQGARACSFLVPILVLALMGGGTYAGHRADPAAYQPPRVHQDWKTELGPFACQQDGSAQ